MEMIACVFCNRECFIFQLLNVYSEFIFTALRETLVASEVAAFLVNLIGTSV